MSPTFKLTMYIYIYENIHVFPKGVKKKKSKTTNPPSSGGHIITTNPAHLMQLGLAMLRRRGAAMAVVDGEEAPPGWYPVVSNGSGSASAPEFLGRVFNPKRKREFLNNMEMPNDNDSHR